MTKFKDSAGREWSIEINVGMVEDIQAHGGIDLDVMMTSPEKFMSMLFTAPRKLVEMLYVILEPQATAQNIDGKAFGRLFNRETLDAATDALLESLVLFYQRSSAGKTVGAKLPQILAKMDREIAKRTSEHFDKVLSDTVIDSRELSVSIPSG